MNHQVIIHRLMSHFLLPFPRTGDIPFIVTALADTRNARRQISGSRILFEVHLLRSIQVRSGFTLNALSGT